MVPNVILLVMVVLLPVLPVMLLMIMVLIFLAHIHVHIALMSTPIHHHVLLSLLVALIVESIRVMV